MAIRKSIPPVETRGITVYLRPDTTRQEVIDRVERYITTGFNFLVLKVLSGGQVLYPSRVTPDGLHERTLRAGQRPDPAAMLLEVAHMHGLPVYAGFDVLQHVSSREHPNDLLARYPSWFIPEDWPPARRINESWKRERQVTGSALTMRFLNPTHPEVRRYLGGLMSEAVESYPFDGLYLDHLILPRLTDPEDLQHRFSRQFIEAAQNWQRDDDEDERASNPLKSPESFHENLRKCLLSFAGYLRQRIYKVRQQLVMVMVSRDPGTPPAPLSVGADANDVGTSPSWNELGEEIPWKSALERAVEIVSPRYDILGAHRIERLLTDLEIMGPEAPVLPVLQLQTDDPDPLPFEQLRRTSVFGFIIDAGRPLSERHWQFFNSIFSGPAVASHNQPLAALQSIVEHMQDILPEDSDVLAVLKFLLRQDVQDPERARKSVINNLRDLERRGRENQLPLPPDPIRWQVTRNIGLLLRLQALLHSQGQMMRATPYYS